MKERLITPEGLSRLSEELEHLKTVGRRRATERVRAALATDADPTANADYLAAREEQHRLEGRIALLENRLAETRVAEPNATNGIVDLGERVRLHDLDTGARLEYELVGSLEADPIANRISAESPLGRALLGLRTGDIALADAPNGRRRFEVVAIESPEPAA